VYYGSTDTGIRITGTAV